MTILDELIEYSKNCINGEIISCEKHKWACERFLKDLENKKFVWDEQEAERIIVFFSKLNHSKGVLARTPIILTTWQKFILCQVYGWKIVDTGLRRFTRSFIEVARKNAKSQMEAGVALYEMLIKAVQTGEIRETYCAGVKREQSAIIFEEAKNMLVGSPLTSYFKITRDRIIAKNTNSFLVPLNKQSGKTGDGTNPALLIIDEYHQHPTTEFYDLGLGANAKESLIMIITTAGVDLNFPCYTQEYRYCTEILDPNFETENESYFIDILEIDKEDDVNNKECWKKANPIRMSYKEGINQIEEAYKLAKAMPEKMSMFLTKCLNKWVQATEDGYMDMGKWKACGVDKINYDVTNKDVYVGFDLSSTIDLTSVSFVVPILQDNVQKYLVYSHSFIPNREKLIERTHKDKVPYDLWERQGYVTALDLPTINQNRVVDYVIDFCDKKKLKINTLCFDEKFAGKLMQELSDEGYNVEAVWQSHRHLNEATVNFRNDVYNKNIIYEKNPVLDFAMQNAVIRQQNGLIKIDKDATKKKIDPVDAVLFAYKLAQYHNFSGNAYGAFMDCFGIKGGD